MKKSLLTTILASAAIVAAVSLTSCETGGDLVCSSVPSFTPVAHDDIKVGLICLHDESSTYDLNFINCMKAAVAGTGLNASTQLVIKTGIGEDQAAYDTACELANDGCNIIFADSFGHEDFIIQAAQEYQDVQFFHATGTKAHTTKYKNYHNAFAAIYEGRYLAGVVAGKKLAAMKEADPTVASKVGYVGAYTYAEVISGYTAWYLGVKSIVSDVTMDVTFTGSWYDVTKEKEGANKLIQNGAVIVSQHADSLGAPSACEEKATTNNPNGVPNVSYNGSTFDTCPKTFLVSSKIDWTPYFELMINSSKAGQPIDWDWTGTRSTESVKLTDYGTAIAPGTAEAVEAAKASLDAGTLHVFDTSTFTVSKDGGKNANATVDANGHLTSYIADVDSDAAYTADTEVVSDGYFHESQFRSAPYFDVQIDGITLLDAAY